MSFRARAVAVFALIFKQMPWDYVPGDAESFKSDIVRLVVKVPPPLSEVPPLTDIVSSTFRLRAVFVAVEIGLLASEVLSTLASKKSVLEIAPLAVNLLNRAVNSLSATLLRFCIFSSRFY